ncbi:Tetratricopeptide repeat-containing domain [Macleaya cordata]|uniref:Tetratricopeptide repeat-containing domain n=1 Tax=Macleaya cordata TaxID=56857 RepID=A0A200QAZ6_MACCD|nr:Tetratricopeptide repeat-containing domain [Macleaya cordata]
MAAEYTPDEQNKSGCGILVIYNGFRRRSFWPRRTASTSSIPTGVGILSLPYSNSKRRRGGSDEAAFLDTSNLSDPPPQNQQPDKKPIIKQGGSLSGNPKTPLPPSNNPIQGKKTASPTKGSSTKKVAPTQGQGQGQGRRVPKVAVGLSGELDSMITDHQRSKTSGGLVRASSSNVMLFGHLGNLRQPGAKNSNSNTNSTANSVLDHLPKTKLETVSTPNGKFGNSNGNSVMGNIVRSKPANDQKEQSAGNLCRALSTTLDPETLKVMGNEEYKKGKFAEALALYDRAIVLDPDKASYRSNKSAALTGLGRILDAVLECREAIRIDPSYHRAHHRLATLNLRLGEAEKALYHFKHSGTEAKLNDIAQAQTLQNHLKKCTEAKKQRDWNTVLQQTRFAISSGADSAPQIFSLQAEALLKLHRHEEADVILMKGPAFDVDACTKFFGPTASAQQLLVRAQVDMAAGRFDDAVAAAQRAAQLDSSNKEMSGVVRRARAVASARSNGNELFKASKFSEACVAYGEGLEHDPLNSVLLCNRAACRFKLSQFERAVEDCTNALNVRPSYSKARLRRADCNAKMERWEASIQDYEMLKRESAGDEEVGRALFEAQVQLKKRRGEDVKDMKFGADVVVISNNERFRQLVTSPGMSVVLFCNKSNDKQALNLLGQLCKRYPSVNFLKVEVEDHPYISKSEGGDFKEFCI